MEIESSKIDFTYLYKIVNINLDRITFRKYSTWRNSMIRLKAGYEIVNLDKEVGEETYQCKPEVIMELAGKTGHIIKGFEVEMTGKKKKKVLVNKIIELEV